MARSDEQALRNEQVFRAANERIADRVAQLETVVDRTPFICECEDDACTQIVSLSREEYERVRSSPRQFVVARGHPTRGEPTGLAGDGWICVVKEVSG